MDQEPKVIQAVENREGPSKSWPKMIFVALAIVIVIEILWAVKLFLEPGEKLATPAQQVIEPQKPSITLVAENKLYKISDEIKVSIEVSTGNSVVDGVDVSLKYDPAVLTVLEDSFIKGSIFRDFPLVKINPQTGVMQVSGISTPGSRGFSGSSNFGSLTFKAKKAVKTFVNVSFSPGSTADSNIIEQQTAKDILQQVVDLELNIQ